MKSDRWYFCLSRPFGRICWIEFLIILIQLLVLPYVGTYIFQSIASPIYFNFSGNRHLLWNVNFNAWHKICRNRHSRISSRESVYFPQIIYGGRFTVFSRIKCTWNMGNRFSDVIAEPSNYKAFYLTPCHCVKFVWRLGACVVGSPSLKSRNRATFAINAICSSFKVRLTRNVGDVIDAHVDICFRSFLFHKLSRNTVRNSCESVRLRVGEGLLALKPHSHEKFFDAMHFSPFWQNNTGIFSQVLKLMIKACHINI